MEMRRDVSKLDPVAMIKHHQMATSNHGNEAQPVQLLHGNVVEMIVTRHPLEVLRPGPRTAGTTEAATIMGVRMPATTPLLEEQLLHGNNHPAIQQLPVATTATLPQVTITTAVSKIWVHRQGSALPQDSADRASVHSSNNSPEAQAVLHRPHHQAAHLLHLLLEVLLLHHQATRRPLLRHQAEVLRLNSMDTNLGFSSFLGWVRVLCTLIL